MAEQPANQEPSASLAARVVVNGVPKPLSYSCVDATAAVGDEVSIELGRRETKGWVIETLPLDKALEDVPVSATKASSEQLGFFAKDSLAKKSGLKSIRSAVRAFLPEQLKLFRWMSEYYGVPLSEVLENAVPRRASSRRILCAMPSSKLIDRIEAEPAFLESLAKKAPSQAKLLAHLAECNAPIAVKELNEIASNPLSPLRSLEKKGFVEIAETSHPAVLESAKGSEQSVFSGKRPNKLTEGQEKALNTISASLRAKKFDPFLLFGVTGSGKTEVYLRAIEEALASGGGGALVIIPEISLTPQFVDQFKARLNVPIALLHSQVGAGARWDAWTSLLDGSVRVAIGARSAVFAPVRDLALMIVDEEHESSYKQSEGFRYQARDTAVMRAKFAECPVLLGSATPSFESLVNVQKRRYALLELPERASARPVPKPELIELGKIRRKDMPTENISPPLHEELIKTMKAGEQAVILYNRRGFASYLQCETCSEVLRCPECSVPYTYHRKADKLLCHYCGMSIPPPSTCPECRDPSTSRIELDEEGNPVAKAKTLESIGKLEHRGSGTEKVVDELRTLFPEAKILRMDRDTVGTKGAYRSILSSMRTGEADILVGTQMIAKGHDLPGVTLVGIIDADVGLHLPDFRSSEKVFQLITQASGRAGRGDMPGRVLVQTREPNHPTLVATVTGRFKAFARYELEYRKKLQYPPMGRLLRLLISSPSLQEAKEGAQLVKATCRDALQQLASRREEEIEAVILGPVAAPYERLRGRYRQHMLVKAPSATLLSELASILNTWRGGVKGFKDFRLSVDVDPVDLL